MAVDVKNVLHLYGTILSAFAAKPAVSTLPASTGLPPCPAPCSGSTCASHPATTCPPLLSPGPYVIGIDVRLPEKVRNMALDDVVLNMDT